MSNKNLIVKKNDYEQLKMSDKRIKYKENSLEDTTNQNYDIHSETIIRFCISTRNIFNPKLSYNVKEQMNRAIYERLNKKLDVK